ncbi:hypothetical protein Q7P37_003497 [Cladosporium fusiforme]
MLTERPTAPLSPPTSPRMSDTPAKANDYNWQTPSYIPTAAGTHREEGAHGFGRLSHAQGHVDDPSRPQLRSYKSFPYSLGPSSRLAHDASTEPENDPNRLGHNQRLVAQGPQPSGSSDLPPATFGGSAPTSPSGRLTPRSGENTHHDEQMLDDDDDADMGPGDADDGIDKSKMTAAELRAHKRKMKRFRLTHNQTRFLMSEFARQAHPDAAHRERLSREIPGLSPRQVQVWFQNRRAKLKRLSTDDRASMMRSRALPDNFDMTQALHSPFGAPTPNMGTPMPSPGAYSHFGTDSNAIRPLTLDTLRRVPDYEHFSQQYASPATISPAVGAFGFTPPQSATDTVSPGSAASEISAFGIHARHHQESPRRPPYGFSMGHGSSFYGSHAQVSRLSTHDRFSRPLAETVSSPLRTSMSYSALGPGAVSQSQPSGRASSFSENSSNASERPQLRNPANPPTSGSGPYGLGFTYGGQMPGYQTLDHSQQQPSLSPGASTSQVEAYQSFRRDSGQVGSLTGSAYPQYQPSGFASGQIPQYSAYAPSYAHQPTFTSPYQQPQSQSGQQPRQPQAQHHSHAAYAPMQSQSQQYVAGDAPSQDDADNSDGGVSVPPAY